MALLCPPGMENPTEAGWVGHALAGLASFSEMRLVHDSPDGSAPADASHSHGSPGHSGNHDSPGDDACPFGSAAAAVCGASATAPAPPSPAVLLLALADELTPVDPTDSRGTLLPYETFRPPRG